MSSDLPDERPALHRHAILVLGVLVLLQALPTLASRDYWAFDEVRHADALRHVLEDGHWFSLHLNGEPYPDKPPVYFWLAAGAARLLGTDGPAAFFLVSALGGLVFVLATWALARLAAPGPDAPLLAALLVMTTVLFQLLFRTTRMDLLFGGIIVFAWVALWRGLGADAQRRWVVLGLGLGGLATVIKGPVGLALPLGALLLFVAWTGRWRRLLRADVLLGLGVAGAWVGAWMIGIGLVEGWDYLWGTLREQVVGRALETHKHSQPFFFYLLILPAAFLPWTTLLAAERWFPRGWRRRVRDALARSRRAPGPTTWIWICFLAGLGLLSIATSKLFIYAMPLLAPLAALAARRILHLTASARTRFLRVLGAGILLAGLGLLLLPWVQPFEAVQLPPISLTALLFLGAGLLLLVPWRRPRAAFLLLLAANVGAAVEVIPAFDAVMSPRAQAERLAALVDRGYAPLVFQVYPGTYSYYARRTLPETRERSALAAHLQKEGPIVIATGRHEWTRNHRDLLGSLVVDHEQRIEGSPFVLLVRPSPARESSR